MHTMPTVYEYLKLSDSSYINYSIKNGIYKNLKETVQI